MKYLPSLWAFLSGLGLQLAFPPFGFWPLALLAPCYWIHHLHQRKPSQTFWVGWWFGLGFFVSGLHWINHSIQHFGHLPGVVAILCVLMLAAYLSLFPATVGWLIPRYRLQVWWALPTLWVISEWLRSTLLTGFPWLLLGYSHTFHPLGQYAALLSVYGVGALSILCSYCCYRMMITKCHATRAMWAAVIAWFMLASPQTHWTKPSTKTTSFHVVQGAAIHKWTMGEKALLQRYLTLSQSPHQILVWPEASILNDQNPLVLSTLQQHLKQHHQTLITGAMRYHDGHWHNGAFMISPTYQQGIDKRQLVPFGEFIPTWLQPWANTLNLPMSQLTPGAIKQEDLKLQHYPIASFICYEIIFPSLVRQLSYHRPLLISLHDSHWFASKQASMQQLQMAEMRVQEHQKPLIYVDNYGLSTVIMPFSHTSHTLPFAKPAAATFQVPYFQGESPYSEYGMLWLGLCLLLLAYCQPPTSFTALPKVSFKIV